MQRRGLLASLLPLLLCVLDAYSSWHTHLTQARRIERRHRTLEKPALEQLVSKIIIIILIAERAEKKMCLEEKHQKDIQLTISAVFALTLRDLAKPGENLTAPRIAALETARATPAALKPSIVAISTQFCCTSAAKPTRETH